MEINYTVRKNVMLVEFDGELDHHAASSAREEIDRIAAEQGVTDIIFDFAGVSFMDSSGIGVILGRYRRVNEKGGRIAITSCSVNIRSILNMAGIFSLTDYFDTSEEAFELFCRKEVS